ncbi:MAG: GNAT family N-acetyltransferase [Crocinitomicaceae bacterium]|nr:GNAT family N-acetyltransferase [Crocinitomicaceae bacterium]
MDDSSIYIRDITPLDAEFVQKWENDPEWNFRENATPYSIMDILQFIHELGDVRKAQQARWIICETETDRPLGAVDLTEIDFAKKEASVGVLIAEKEDRRKGYAFQALELIEEKAKDLEIDRLISTVFKSNSGSLDLFIKNCFVKIGETDVPYLSEATYIKAIIFEKWVK